MSSERDCSVIPSSSNDKDGLDQDPDIPDRSYGDYYCKMCDSHMNSDNMWDAHITGKRHIKNVKKGDTDSKYEELKGVESSIKYELRNVKDPVVGLDYIHEIRRKEPNVPPIYNCFLCHASIATVPLVTEHVISMKHRLNYIKERNPEEYQLIDATNLKKGHMEPLVVDAARNLEQRDGRGTVKVKQEKQKAPYTTYSSRKTYSVDDDDAYKRTYSSSSKFDSNSSVWKSVDTEHQPRWEKGRDLKSVEKEKSLLRWEKGRDLKSVDTEKHVSRRERSRSPRDFEVNHKKRSRSISPRNYREKKRMPYSDEENSRDGYSRSSSKRIVHRDDYETHRSFSKRDVSPKRDYNYYKSTNDYLQPSRVRDSHDELYLRTPRYENDSPRETSQKSYTITRESAQKSYSNPSYEASTSSSLPQQTSHVTLPAVEKQRQPTLESVLKDTLLLTSEECYNLFYVRMRSLPDIKTINEILAVTRCICELQAKMKNRLSPNFLSAFLESQKSDNAANIPGLGDVNMSTEQCTQRNTHKPSETEIFLSKLLTNSNFASTSKTQSSPDKSSVPFQQSTSYAPGNFQGPATNSYQGPTTNLYPSPPTNSYPNQAAYPNTNVHLPPTTSFPNQAPYPNTNVRLPPAQGNVPNYSVNMPPGIAGNTTPQPQVFNYSHFSSPSSSHSNFPPKY